MAKWMQTQRKRLHNLLKEHLWADDAFAHYWLCHDGEECQCPDGCDTQPIKSCVEFYQSDLEK